MHSGRLPAVQSFQQIFIQNLESILNIVVPFYGCDGFPGFFNICLYRILVKKSLFSFGVAVDLLTIENPGKL